MHILFICTGNTCRSPMAEGFANRWIKSWGRDDITVTSAGILAQTGAPASEHAISVMQAYGVDMSAHRARQVDAQMLEAADVVLVLSVSHVRTIGRLSAAITQTLMEAATGTPGDVLDPFGGSIAMYESVAKKLDTLVSLALEKLCN